MPPRQDAVLLSGATGFVGAALLARYLDHTDRPIFALVRARNASEADTRLRAILHELYDPATARRHAQRCTAVAGDLQRSRLGLGASDREQIAREVSEVIHCAASVSFDLPLPEARAINAAGVRRVAQLAELCAILGDGLERFAHVSTAYVAGDHDGRFAENDPYCGAGFRNTYEQTKYEGEQVLRRWTTPLPLQVIRPSIVVGSRHSGWTRAFNVLYWPLQMFSRGRLPMIPARSQAPVDVVPVDYVADAILALADAPPATYHLVAGEHATTVGDVIALAAERFDVPAPQLLAPETTDADADADADRGALTDAQARVLHRARVYFPYFGLRVRFDDRATRAVLEPTGVRTEPLHRYFDTLMDYAQRAQWGRAPLTPHELSVAA
jgi:thioester reductase-like protein